MRSRLPSVTSVLLCVFAVGASFLLSGCGGQPQADSGTPLSASTAGGTSSAVPTPATTYVNDLVGEAQIGSAYHTPGEITLADAAEDYVPPESVPVYRVVPAGPVTRETMDALADTLGFGPDRTYFGGEGLADGREGLSNSRWLLTFFWDDIDFFMLHDTMFDMAIPEKLEAGEAFDGVSLETARQVADEYLAASGYADGLEYEGSAVRQSVTGQFAGRPEATYYVSIGVDYVSSLDGVRLIGAGASIDVGPEGEVVAFRHTLQHAEPAGEVKLRPVGEALEDLAVGLGQTVDGDLSRLTVEQIEIAYYRPPLALPEGYYKPVYVFHVRTADDQTGEWLLSAYTSGGSASSPDDAGGSSGVQSTPTTEAGYPVLEELPQFNRDQVALVEVRAYDEAGAAARNAPPTRVLSPEADADAVAALLNAYRGIRLAPGEGFPELQDSFMSVVFHLRDGSYVWLSPQPNGRVGVGCQAQGLTTEGWASPHARGYSSEFTPLAQKLAQSPSRDFGPGFKLPGAMPKDFALVLAYGVTLRNVLDTAASTFTKDLITAELPTVTAALPLSPGELEDIYRDLRRLDIAGYSSLFRPENTTGYGHTPYMAYYLHLRVAGQEKEIYWADYDDSTAPDAVALRDLLKKIRTLIEARPEFRALPAAEGGYE